MTDKLVEIGAPGIDVDKLVQEIQERVAAKTAAGAYADPRVVRAERTNLANIKGEQGFVDLYLQCLRDAVFVNIGDFEIRERRAALRPLLVAMKRTIWKLLKFYTYRLWSQQNEVNGLLLSTIEAIESRHRERTEELERRIAALESEKGRPTS